MARRREGIHVVLVGASILRNAHREGVLEPFGVDRELSPGAALGVLEEKIKKRVVDRNAVVDTLFRYVLENPRQASAEVNTLWEVLQQELASEFPQRIVFVYTGTEVGRICYEVLCRFFERIGIYHLDHMLEQLEKAPLHQTHLKQKELRELLQYGWVRIEDNQVKLTPEGKTFWRAAKELAPYHRDIVVLKDLCLEIPHLHSDQKFPLGLAHLFKELLRLFRILQQRGQVFLHATGGFKPESAIAVLAANHVRGIPIFYIHESFKRLVRIPATPIRLVKRGKFWRLIQHLKTLREANRYRMEQLYGKRAVEKLLREGWAVLDNDRLKLTPLAEAYFEELQQRKRGSKYS